MNTKSQMELMSPRERIEFLRTQATNIRQGNYFRQFTDDELDSKKDELVEQCINIDVKEVEFTDIKKTYGDEIKSLKKLRASLTDSIKIKGENTSGEIFEFAEHEDGLMVSFDEQGNVIGSRKLRPEEKQSNLFINSKTA